MNRRLFIFAMTASIACAGAASAATFQELLVAQLKAQGFSSISVRRTLLGRVRIEATSGTHEREIIFNPRTGEILRDYWEVVDDNHDNGGTGLVNPSSGGSVSDDDDGDDDENEEEDDEADEKDEKDEKDDEKDDEEDDDE